FPGTLQFLFQEVTGSLPAHDIPDSSFNLLSHKRLRYEMLGSGLQEPHPNFVGLLGGQQNEPSALQFRPAPDIRYHFLAADFRHHDVAHNQVWFVFERLLETLLAVERRDDVVFRAQRVDDKLIHFRVVLDDQDRALLNVIRGNCLDRKLWCPQFFKQRGRNAHWSKRMIRPCSHLCIGRGKEWDSYDEERSTASWRGLPDRAVMKLHKFLHNGEPEPCASMPARNVFFNLDKALENSFAHSNRNAWAIVLNLKDSIISSGFQHA